MCGRGGSLSIQNHRVYVITSEFTQNVCVCVCVRVHMCTCVCTHVCVYTCTCACVHCVCVRVYVCVCARMCVRVCTRTCVRVCMCTCVHVCTCTCVRLCMRVHVYACMRMYVWAHAHVCVCVYLWNVSCNQVKTTHSWALLCSSQHCVWSMFCKWSACTFPIIHFCVCFFWGSNESMAGEVWEDKNKYWGIHLLLRWSQIQSPVLFCCSSEFWHPSMDCYKCYAIISWFIFLGINFHLVNVSKFNRGAHDYPYVHWH